MNNNYVKHFNRFEFIEQVAKKLHEMKCDLADTDGLRRSDGDVDPTSYLILGPNENQSKGLFRFFFNRRSKILCQVITEYINESCSEINKITFSVYGLQNVNFVNAIFEKVYDHLLISTDIFITIGHISEWHETQ